MKKACLLPVCTILAFAVPVLSTADEIYKVKRGDTLYAISAKFQVSADKVREANHLTGDHLRPGAKLTIPTDSPKAASRKEARAKERDADKAGAARATKPLVHTVRKGDTLQSLSKKYSVSVKELQQLNGLKKGSKLKAGVALRIQDAKADDAVAGAQGGSDASGGASAGSTNGRDAAPKKKSSVARVEVKKGDTLKSIARQHSLSVAELRELNGLKKNAKLKPGMTLTVRAAGARTYIVKRGDNLWRIARKLHVSTEELARLNHLGRGGVRVGQKLVVEEVAEVAEDSPEKVAENEIDEAKVYEDMKALSEADDAAPQTVTLKERAIRVARRMLDIPYRFGGSTLRGIDCSAYVQKVFRFLNIPLPRTAREQFQHGEDVGRDELAAGDLVFFRTYARFPSHVGIYLGNNQFIHASSIDKKVAIDSLEQPYYSKRFIGGRRLVREPTAPSETAEKISEEAKAG